MRSRCSRKTARLIIARNIGFCFGVRRAIDAAQNVLKDGKTVYSLGSIIHNPQAVKRLSEKGLKTVRDIGRLKNATLLIASHGAEPGIIKKAEKKRLKIINATCPRVITSQRLARSLDAKGSQLVIVGDKRHPEVRSLKGVSGNAVVIENSLDASRFDAGGKNIGVVVQSTQSKANFFSVLSELVKKDFGKIEILNTLCRDTLKRQEEAGRLAGRCGLMIVVGGKESANTKRLFEICKKISDTYHIETGRELKKSWFKGVKKIGLVSGTSTPDWVINEAADRVNELIKDSSLKKR